MDISKHIQTMKKIGLWNFIRIIENCIKISHTDKLRTFFEVDFHPRSGYYYLGLLQLWIKESKIYGTKLQLTGTEAKEPIFKQITIDRINFLVNIRPETVAK